MKKNIMRDIVIIDHDDSFVYNITESIRRISGSKPMIINYRDFDLKSGSFSALIISPGPGVLKHYQKTFHIIGHYFQTKPILGICLGFQMLAAYSGAGFVKNDFPVHGVDLEVKKINKGRLLKNIPGRFRAGYYHSWHVSELPEEWLITARDEKGRVAAIEHKNFPVFGVQFHPESFLTEYGEKIFENFLNEIRSIHTKIQ